MKIDDLTIGQAKELAALFGGANPSIGSPWVVGRDYLIRTVTMTLTGRLVAVFEQEIVLEYAAWIADTGRFSDALKTGSLDEVEPIPDGPVIIGRGSVIDAAVWDYELPRTQK